MSCSDEPRNQTAQAVVIATGVSYRKVDIASLEPFEGVGVYYGAAISEAAALAGQDVFVVEPFTQWLPPDVARDDWGFVITGPSDRLSHGCHSSRRFAVCSPSVMCDATRPSASPRLSEKLPFAYGSCTSTSPGGVLTGD